MYSQIGPLASERHREMMAEARQQRPAWLLLAFHKASRRADRAQRRLHQARRTASRLRANL
jgi:hypothetical protein